MARHDASKKFRDFEDREIPYLQSCVYQGELDKQYSKICKYCVKKGLSNHGESCDYCKINYNYNELKSILPKFKPRKKEDKNEPVVTKINVKINKYTGCRGNYAPYEIKFSDGSIKKGKTCRCLYGCGGTDDISYVKKGMKKSYIK